MEQHPEIDAVWGPNPACERGYAFAMNSSSDGSKIVYGSGKNLVVRDSVDVTSCSVVTKHTTSVTVAKFSNNSNKIMSADQNGGTCTFNVKGNQLELEKQMMGIGGRVYDLCWYPNDKGLACVGDAKGTNGRVFTTSGTDQGKISGTKRLTSVDIFFFDDDHKKIQEAKLVTSCDDLLLRVYKYKGGFNIDESDVATTRHSQNANMVRFSPDGKYLVSVGGKEIKILDTENGFKTIAETKGDKKKGEHAGNIYAVTWAHDSSCFLTASADKSVKLWAVEGTTLVLKGTVDLKGKADFGISQADFQVGCCYVGDGATHRFASLSLSGDIQFYSVGSDLSLTHDTTIIAPTQEIVALDVNRADGTIAVGTSNGEVLVYDKAGTAKRVKGLKDPKRAVGIANFGDTVLSTGWDDCVRSIAADSMKPSNRTLALPGQPVSMTRGSGSSEFAALATKTEVMVISKSNPSAPVAKLAMGGAEATCCAVSGDGKMLAIGTADKFVRFYTVDGGSISPNGVVTEELLNTVTSMTFSADGNFLALGLKNKYVHLVDMKGEVLADSWTKHTAAVNDVDFSPDGKWLLSAGMEGDLAIWNLAKPKAFKPHKHFRLAHPTGVSSAKWADDSTIYSAGAFDGAIKRWIVKL